MDSLVGRSDVLSIAGWSIGSPAARVVTVHRPRLQVDQSSFRYELEARRQTQFFAWKLFFPLLFIVFMSWAVFWISPTNINPRISLSSTSMLTLFAYQSAIASLLPRISYLTRADKFTLMSSTLIFFALIVSVTISALSKDGAGELAERLDGWSRRLFPATFVVLASIIFLM